MARHCEQCGFEVSATAKFCKACGADLPPVRSVPAKDAPPAASAVAPSPPAVEVQYCERCRTKLLPGAQFCKRCGKPIPGVTSPAEGEGASVLPPRDLRHRSERPRGPRVGGVPRGIRVAAFGAAIALAGCFLPLLSGWGENISVIPTLLKEVPQALVLPLSIVVIAVMAWAALSSPTHPRALLGAGVIAVASPWAALCVVGLFAARQAMSALGAAIFGGDVGPGIVFLSIGFLVSVLGGFVIVSETVRELLTAEHKVE